MTDKELLEIAKDAGFYAALIPSERIVMNPVFRQCCEDNLCGNYNANYSCPPDCGSVEQTRQRLLERDRALVLQTIWDIVSYEKKVDLLTAKKAHNAAILTLTEELRRAGLQGFCLGYGGCPLCSPCKRRENQPCAHPDKKISCLSAYCVDVTRLAEECGLEFGWTPDKLYLFGMFAFNQQNRQIGK